MIETFGPITVQEKIKELENLIEGNLRLVSNLKKELENMPEGEEGQKLQKDIHQLYAVILERQEELTRLHGSK